MGERGRGALPVPGAERAVVGDAGRRTRGEWPLSCEETSGKRGRPLGGHAGQDGERETR